jgi:thiamine biosynthesis lipoprotein
LSVTAGSSAPAAPAGTQFPAFGSTVGIWLTDPATLSVAEGVLRDWVARVDLGCSRFRADSDLSRANASAGRAVGVGPELIAAVEIALELAADSDGWYDPTVGAAVIAAGYDRTLVEVVAAGPGPLRAAAPAGRWREVAVDRAAGTLTVPRGVELDLGGSAKGWAVDRGLELVAAAVGPGVGVCISAGGDLGATGPAPDGGWPVRISHSLDGEAGPGDEVVGLLRGAVATSGAVRRAWRIDGKLFHHLVDPRTGRPGQERWRLVTVHSGLCAWADAAATVAWLMGDTAPAWLESRALCARLVDTDGQVRWIGLGASSLRRHVGVPA